MDDYAPKAEKTEYYVILGYQAVVFTILLNDNKDSRVVSTHSALFSKFYKLRRKGFHKLRREAFR